MVYSIKIISIIKISTYGLGAVLVYIPLQGSGAMSLGNNLSSLPPTTLIRLQSCFALHFPYFSLLARTHKHTNTDIDTKRDKHTQTQTQTHISNYSVYIGIVHFPRYWPLGRFSLQARCPPLCLYVVPLQPSRDAAILCP